MPIVFTVSESLWYPRGSCHSLRLWKRRANYMLSRWGSRKCQIFRWSCWRRLNYFNFCIKLFFSSTKLTYFLRCRMPETQGRFVDNKDFCRPVSWSRLQKRNFRRLRRLFGDDCWRGKGEERRISTCCSFHDNWHKWIVLWWIIDKSLVRSYSCPLLTENVSSRILRFYHEFKIDLIIEMNPPLCGWVIWNWATTAMAWVGSITKLIKR